MDGKTSPIPKLPSGWISLLDYDSPKLYYVETGTGISQWEIPTRSAAGMGSQSEPFGRGMYYPAMQPLETVLTARMSESDHLPLSSGARDSYRAILPGPVYVQANEQDLSRTQILANRLDTFFRARALEFTYTDADIYEITTLLRQHTPKWGRVPRTYIVLRTINRLDLLDECLAASFSDYWFPVTEQSLPDFLPLKVWSAIFDAQTLILTKSMDLEKCDAGEHCSLEKGEAPPLERKGILGQGAYGQVDKVLSLISFREYARKRVLRSTIFRGRKKEDVKRFVAEIQILKRLKHDHIVKFAGSYTDARYLALIMTPITDGDLAVYMVEATSAKFPELRTFFGCLATALDYLHSQDIRHKDIKPTNILVSNGTVLLADFGLSLDYADASGSTTMGIADSMTPRYCALEVAKHESRNTKSDIWCLGIVFLEMIVTLKGTKMPYMDHFFKQHGTREVFIHLNTIALPEFIVHVAALGRSFDNTPLEWTERMLLVSQVDRPTASELATHIMTRGMKERDIRFCGICCIAAEKEEFSDYSIE